MGDDEDLLTGTKFMVQLKGKKSHKQSRDKKNVIFRLDKKHAEYYADKIKDLPVFLVVVDTTLERGWYLFIQSELLRDNTWRNNKDVPVNIPLANLLSDRNGLRSAVIEANQVMRGRHPTAIKDAIEARREFFQKQDPRFHVDVAVIGNSVRMHARSKEPIPLKVIVKGKPSTINKKWFDLSVLGCAVKFNQDELTIEGSELMKWVGKCSEGVVLQLAKPVSGEAKAIISYLDKDNVQVAQLEIPGQLRVVAPTGCLAFEGHLAGTLCSLIFGPIHQGKSMVRNPVDCSQWNGHRLLHLPFFEQVATMCNVPPTVQSRTIRCEDQGNLVCTISQSFDQSYEQLPSIRNFFEILNKARYIAAKLGVNPIFNFEVMTPEFNTMIICFYELLSNGRYEYSIVNIKDTISIEKISDEDQISDNVDGSGCFSIEMDGTGDLFGEAIDVKPYLIVYVDVSHTYNRSDGGDNVYDIVIEGNERSTVLLCRDDPVDETAEAT